MPFRENLLAAFTAFFEYIPSKEEYTQISDENFAENSLVHQASTILSETEVIKNSELANNSLSINELSAIIVEKLLPDIPREIEQNDDLIIEAQDYILYLLGLNSLTETLYIAVNTLLNSNSANLLESKTILQNKIALAEYVINDIESASISSSHVAELFQSLNSNQISLEQAFEAVDQTSQSWHFIVYMMADNNLEQFALNDLKELTDLAASGYASVSVAIDRSDNHDTSLGDWTDTRYGNIDGNQSIIQITDNLTSAGEINMGDSESLTAFINWSVDQNPADHYALILWNHGLGHDGIGVDEGNNNDSLSLAEINQGIDNSNLNQLDQVIFDACSMAMIEVASALSSVTHSIVASQDIVPNEGINYSSLANYISDSNGIADSEHLENLITQSYSDYFGELSTMALSVLDTGKTVGFINAINVFTDEVLRSTNADWLKIQQSRNSAEYYYDNQSIDLHSFLTTLIQSSPTASLTDASEELLDASREIIVSNTAVKEQSEGLSIYWPNRDMGSYYQNQYEETVADIGLSNWGSFIEKYWDF